MEIREHPPSMQKTSTAGPLGGARARDSRVPTINAKKHRRRAPGRMLTEI
jgi:hypothetical protein